MEFQHLVLGISVFLNIVQWMIGSQRKQALGSLRVKLKDPDFLLMRLRRITRSRRARWDENSAPQFDMDVARPGDVADSDELSDDWEQPHPRRGIWPYIVALGVFLFILSNAVSAFTSHP